MRTTIAQSFISQLDSSSFRELVWLILHCRGYRSVLLTDGSYDGGTDFRVLVDGVSNTQIAVQVSVEKDWKKKVERDAKKAKSKLGLSSFEYISSRRIPEASFQPIAENLRANGISARKVDAAALAGYVIRYDLTLKLLELAGISAEDLARLPSRRLSAEDEAALACTLFSDESHDFRKGVTESAISFVLMNSHPVPVKRQTLVAESKALMGRGFVDVVKVNSEIDSLLARGYLRSTNGELSFTEDSSSEISATFKMRDAMILEALALIRTEIAKYCDNKITSSDADKILELIGVLIREGQDMAVSPLQDVVNKSLKATESSRQRFQALHRTLDEMGVVEGAARDELVFGLAQSVAQSSLGHVLAAGELYINMASHNGASLKVALDGGSEIRVLLDASVAMPLLIGLLHGTTGSPSADLAFHFYNMCRERDIGLTVTDFYISECASHLINAYDNWGAIADAVPDLAGSGNFFVSAFARLKSAGRLGDANFSKFLSSLGLAGFVRNGDTQVARDQVSSNFSRLFARADIKVERSVKLDASTRRRVNAVFDHLVLQLDRPRDHILVQHDEKAIGILEERAASQRSLWWFCTWHGLHFSVARELNASWMPFTPIGLIELLGTLIPLDIEPPTSVGWLIRVAKESTVARAALVWDILAKIERAEFENAELFALARDFHGQYMAAMRDEPSAKAIRDDWARFKEAHGYSDASDQLPIAFEEVD